MAKLRGNDLEHVRAMDGGQERPTVFTAWDDFRAIVEATHVLGRPTF
jgi:hypothetical protein